MKKMQLLVATLVGCGTAGLIAVLAAEKAVWPSPGAAVMASALQEDLAPLGTADEWLNSPPLTAASVHGKVVVVQFWTYSCINWLRTLPYVRAWADKYKDEGLVVVGVHSPEFEFEKDLDNIRRYSKEMGIGYPVAIDSDFSIWRAFNNQYWPALYFVDAEGRIRHHQFGEGDYEQSERMIQKLLAETGQTAVSAGLVSNKARDAEVAADWANLKSPETYIGYGRAGHFASPGGMRPDSRRNYSIPPRLTLNNWAMDGNWTVRKQFAVMNEANGRVAYRFHARDLHLVMGPTKRGATLRFRVLIDGQPPGNAHGADVDTGGYGTLTGQRLYQLIRQPQPIMDRTFSIEFIDPGAEVFAFTFG